MLSAGGWKLGSVTSAILFGSYGYYKLRRNHQYGLFPPQTKYSPFYVPPNREEMIERMKSRSFDVIVIGGGATGSGVALDSASRGLSCALLERDDFGSGASSKSTKLIHGGVRYLENVFKNFDLGQLKLVVEALEERSHMLQSAPYMSKAVPVILPIYECWKIPYFYMGIKMYDFLAKVVTLWDPRVPSCHFLKKENTKALFPLLKSQNLKGSLLYYDGQHNDSRMNFLIALTSTIPAYVPGMVPASIANHCELVQLLHDETGRINGVEVLDRISNEKFRIKGKVVINCTGVHADSIRHMNDRNSKLLITASAGSHLVLPRAYTPMGIGCLASRTSDKRVLFFLPWENSTLVGTTDKESQITFSPKASESELEFILKETGRFLNCDPDLLKKDILSVWSGLRPLINEDAAEKRTNDKKDASTSTLSRSHLIIEEKGGLISVMGGKWTTYRRMAQDALDYAISKHVRELNPKNACRTKNMKLLPALDVTNQFSVEDSNPENGRLMQWIRKTYGLNPQQASHLVSNYGFLSRNVCELGLKTSSLVPVVEGSNFLKAEIFFAIRNEMARTSVDILERRLRLSFLDAKAALGLVEQIADILSSELKWTKECRDRDVKNCTDHLQRMVNPLR